MFVCPPLATLSFDTGMYRNTCDIALVITFVHVSKNMHLARPLQRSLLKQDLVTRSQFARALITHVCRIGHVNYDRLCSLVCTQYSDLAEEARLSTTTR